MNAPAPFYVAIPARFASTRLPGKPLREIAGRPMIEHVYRQAVSSGAADIVIATDDRRIYDAAEKLGARALMTRGDHVSGTDRIAEAAMVLAWPDDAVVVNLQGDEPRMPPALIRQVASTLTDHPEAGIATLATKLETRRDLADPNVVKVVCDARGFALYFSRAPIPWDRDRFASNWELVDAVKGAKRHLGLYAYRSSILQSYPQWPAAPMEELEKLEQLRALWHGIRVIVADATQLPDQGVDTEADLLRLNALSWSEGE